ncbi:MAG: hydrogenase expression/formation protein HypE [Phycisphaeraceae bacterium]|nr:hydrogenase expression/formation protein HypE [Phycisphaeraceae bacterium]
MTRILETDNALQRIIREADAAPPGSQLLLAHGGGGRLTDQLLGGTILQQLDREALADLPDAALLEPGGDRRLALTMDGFVVDPWSFPGGDIGRLAVCGTVNDLAVGGAEPVALALGLILAEGLERKDLETIMASVAAASKECGVRVVTGDTKVVGRSQADGVYLTTAGVGWQRPAAKLSVGRIRIGDRILINGNVGDHGLAVMLRREMPEVESVVRSDVAPLNGLVGSVLNAGGEGVRFMRDPTRAGVSGVVVDLAADTGLHVQIEEKKVPVDPATRHAADMLGLDVLDVANEGKVLVVVDPESAPAVLEAMRNHPLGRDASDIGQVTDATDGRCELLTRMGGQRLLQKTYGQQLPRIC